MTAWQNKQGKKQNKLVLKRTHFSKPQLLVFVLVFALIGFLIYRSFAAGNLVASLEAEQMTLPAGASVITDNGASGGKAFQMLNNGTSSGAVNFPSSVTSFNVIARGDQCSGAPNMTVALDGSNLISNVSVSATGWTNYTATPLSAVNSGSHSLSISFTNDYNYVGRTKHGKITSSCDRNLYVDVINFYGPAPVAPAPTVTISASPASISSGQSSTLTWGSTNATSCNASGAWSGTQQTSGSVSTGALNQDSTYNLTCTGAGGSATAKATVSVAGGITWTFCAKEYATCSFSGTQNVRFGANGLFVTKTFTNSVFCDVSVFGDPDPGVDKECDTSPTTTTGGGGTTGAIPKHIETWAYDGFGPVTNEGSTASAALVSSWLTYAETDGSNTKALNDCHSTSPGCKALVYLDTNRIYYDCSGCSVPISSAAAENWWLHQPGYSDSAHRIVASFNGSTHANILNQSNTAVQNWFQNYARQKYDSYDGFMLDDQAPGLHLSLFPSGYNSSQEVTTDSQINSAHQSIAGALTHSNGSPFTIINNSLTVNPNLPQGLNLLNTPSNVAGILSENNPVGGGAMTPYYATLLDTMAYVDNQSSGSAVIMSQDGSGSAQWRRVHASTVLLGYKPERTVSWTELEYSSSNLNIFPESGIYPTNPVQSMNAPSGSGCFGGTGTVCSSGGHNDIQVASGIYRREFGSCYNQGVSIGRCAVIVNSTGGAVTTQSSWFSTSYGHQITFNGGDVQSGGSLNLTGSAFSAGSTAVGAHDALLLTQ